MSVCWIPERAIRSEAIGSKTVSQNKDNETKMGSLQERRAPGADDLKRDRELCPKSVENTLQQIVCIDIRVHTPAERGYQNDQEDQAG